MQSTEGQPNYLIIKSIELRELRLPLIHFFETSFGRTTERRIVLVRLTDSEGAEGWGECTAGEGPFYSDEWTDTAWSTIREFLGPMVLGKNIDGANAAFSAMKPVRGHRMAKATIENAFWDLEAKKAGVPLWQHL
jgi:O-succinylbenzoate synthase